MRMPLPPVVVAAAARVVVVAVAIAAVHIHVRHVKRHVVSACRREGGSTQPTQPNPLKTSQQCPLATDEGQWEGGNGGNELAFAFTFTLIGHNVNRQSRRHLTRLSRECATTRRAARVQ